MGKFAEAVAAGDLSDPVRRELVQAREGNLADQSPSVGAKAVRSLGKLACCGHLTPEDRAHLKSLLAGILARDQRFEWDRAYLVRREAEAALTYL